MSEEQTPVEMVPPASRMGEIVGWSLVALAAACFIAFIVAIVQADAASQAVQHAEDAWHNAIVTHPDHTMTYAATYEAAYKAADAAYREAKVFTYLLLGVCLVFLSIIPGLLYTMKPSLLGGPIGRLLRPHSEKVARRLPQRRHPVTFYQGIGMALMSIGPFSNILLQAASALSGVPSWLFFGALPVALLLYLASFFIGLSLFGEARWWFTRGWGAERGQERPQA